MFLTKLIHYSTLMDNHLIGFRIEPRVSLYLRQIIEDLVASGEVDLTSSYHSLRSKGSNPWDMSMVPAEREGSS